MPFVLLLIGLVLVVAAYRNTQGDLAAALAQDVPGFLVWALAIVGVGALGWVPGMRPVSRSLMTLVLLVIVLKNYQAILAGFTGLESTPSPSTAAASPTSQYLANPTGPQITQAAVSGTGLPVPSGTGTGGAVPSGNINTAGIMPAVTSPLGALDPAAFLTAFEAGLGGFGGIA
jgi:hypothetical protein